MLKRQLKPAIPGHGNLAERSDRSTWDCGNVFDINTRVASNEPKISPVYNYGTHKSLRKENFGSVDGQYLQRPLGIGEWKPKGIVLNIAEARLLTKMLVRPPQ